MTLNHAEHVDNLTALRAAGERLLRTLDILKARPGEDNPFFVSTKGLADLIEAWCRCQESRTRQGAVEPRERPD